MKIKRITLSDIKNIAGLFHEYRKTSVSIEPGSAVNDSEKWLTDRIRSNEAVLFGAFKEDKIVGFATLYQGFSSISLKKYWILNDLYVLPELRRKGIAGLLMSETHKFAVSTGAKGIELETARFNRAAQTLYENLGYKEELLYKRYFKTTE
jgi:ribosomal protein S18 acetylase RimI-like enzyme